ncbi:hypothetical protein BUY22_02225 [Staphylococcus cohnii]|nr:hypothetical protein BUY22_02225 [Staphylococcus cohnii]
MSEFNIKHLDPSVPQRVYSELNDSVNFGDTEATARTVVDGKTGYLLGGLLLSDILSSSLSEDTIGRLSNALSSDNVSYAVFPNDIRKGQIPLILTDKVRNYINNNLTQLAQSNSVKWRVFFLPDGIDPDDNELAQSEIIEGEDGQPLGLNLNDLEDYFKNNGQVNNIDDDDMFDTEAENATPKVEDEAQPENSDENDDNDLLEDGTPDVDKFDFGDDQMEASQGAFDPNEEASNDEETSNDKEKQKEPKKDVSNPLNNIEDEDEEGTFFDNSTESEKSSNTQAPKSTSDNQNENVEATEQQTEGSHKEIYQESSKVKPYMAIPDTLQTILNDIYIGRFNDFPEDEVYKESNKVMRKEIKNANDKIEKLTNDIKRSAKELYFNYMTKSYETITATIDIENGNPKVIEQRQKVSQDEAQIEREFKDIVRQKKEKLEENFYGEQLEAYKQEVLAKIKQDFEYNYYHIRVKEPLKEYENELSQEYDAKKTNVRGAFDAWLTNVEDTALDKDRNKAIQQVSHYIENEMRKANDIVSDIDDHLVNMNDQYLKIESINKSKESLKESMRSELLTDEEAQAYKHRLKEVADEKTKLEKNFEDLKKQHEEDKKQQQAEQAQAIENMKSDHSEVVENKQKENEKLSTELSDLKSTRDKLKEDKRKHRKKQIGTGIGGFVISALIFGGVAFGTHGQNKDMEEKIDSQTKVANEQKAKAEKNQDELDKLKKQSKAEKEKQDKIIADQKKEIEDAKKDKKDKKDKKKD